MSDHSSFIATLNETAKLCQPKEKINYRSYRKFDIDNFKNDPNNSDLIQKLDPNSVTSLYTQYHDTMLTLLDKHAPLKSCKVTSNARPVNAWITDEILLSKRKKRQLERRWRRNRTDSNRSRLNAQVHLCNRLMTKAKKNYYTNLVSGNITNPGKLLDTMKYILHKNTNNILPDSSCNTKLASSFNDFFISGIAKIRDTLMSAKSDSNIHPEPTPPAAPNPLLTFTQISESNVSKLIRSSPSKSCDLDPCPTQIVKDSADILAGQSQWL